MFENEFDPETEILLARIPRKIHQKDSTIKVKQEETHQMETKHPGVAGADPETGGAI